MSIETLPHDEIVGFTPVAPTTPPQILSARFQPTLTVLTGRVPHPGVDAEGRISAGLGLDHVSAGATDSPGQAYSRPLQLEDHWAIVYACYFPRDCPSPGRGHPHDREGAVVWLRGGVEDAEMLSFSYSQHGRLFPVVPSAETTHEGRPMLAYSRYTGKVTHSMWQHYQPGVPAQIVDLLAWTRR